MTTSLFWSPDGNLLRLELATCRGDLSACQARQTSGRRTSFGRERSRRMPCRI